MTDWYYESNGASVGPRTREQIEALHADGVIKRTTRVWNAAFGNDWKRFDTIDDLSETPPAAAPSAGPVTDVYVWLVAAVPVVGATIETLLEFGAGLSGIGTNSIYLYAAVNLALGVADNRAIKAARPDAKPPNVLVMFLLAPAYLFMRSRRLGKGQEPFWAWLASFALSLAITLGLSPGKTYYGFGLPSCDSETSVAQVQSLFLALPSNTTGIKAQALEAIETVRTSPERNSCKARIVASDGLTYAARYVISDRDGMIYYELSVDGTAPETGAPATQTG
ncbi:DUF4339 domain-containing protein [Aurantimonas sp. VKM B-3413]|uniref:DUF4339 domain-containing protein n=1 Tax=Aurantimonas sp. VKM B-3413 TaxID=2779401 RepID=UPI001E55A693|nr:DUF4339 domain-containing protein [Aurantimonas sp. VKM B-3413]MCB8839998.1 DUF4339 domain-containing protein [Aurantimonas sp. VKM B-3413]